MNRPITVRVDSKGRITIPKEVRIYDEIKQGDTLILNAAPGVLEFTQAVEDPLAVLRDYAWNEYYEGKTIELEKYVEDEGITIDYD